MRISQTQSGSKLGFIERKLRYYGLKKLIPYTPTTEGYINKSEVHDDSWQHHKTKAPRLLKRKIRSLLNSIPLYLLTHKGKYSPNHKETQETHTPQTSEKFKVNNLSNKTAITFLSSLDDLKSNYTGYKATARHLDTLKDNLFNMGITKHSDEADSHFKHRIDEAVKRSFSKDAQITDKQFGILKQLLPTPEYLAENAKREELSDSQKAMDSFTACRRYFVEGEGQKILEELGFPKAGSIQGLLPELTLDAFDSSYLSTLKSLQTLKEETAPTDTNSLTDASIEHDFFLSKEKTSKITFSSKNRYYRCLIILDSIEKYYTALKTSAAKALQDAMVATENLELDKEIKAAEEKLSSALELERKTKKTIDSMSHTLMFKAFPKEFGPREGKQYSYQHTILRAPDGYILWDSDDRQFRGGRKD